MLPSERIERLERIVGKQTIDLERTREQLQDRTRRWLDEAAKNEKLIRELKDAREALRHHRAKGSNLRRRLWDLESPRTCAALGELEKPE